jgi:biotin carboxylase
MSRIVFIESNTTGTGALAVGRLLREGHHVVFLTRNPGLYSFLRAPDDHLDVIEVDSNDSAALVAALEPLRSAGSFDGILTFSDFYVAVVAEVASVLGLKYLSAAAARTCREKPRTRAALRAAGLPTPIYRLVTGEAAIHAAAAEVSYPCVVKPPSDSSSHGVRLVRTPQELIDQCSSIAGWVTNTRGQQLDGSVLIESLVEGPEYSVETVTLGRGQTEVIGVTQKHLSAPPHFVEMGHEFPASLPASVYQALSDAALRGLEAVGFDYGPAHTEIRWTSTGPVIIEINPRLAGGMIPEIVAQATGIDLLGACLDLALGRPVTLTPARRDVSAIAFLTAPAAGTLTGVRGVEEARRLPSIAEVTVTRAPGSSVRLPEDAYDRLGFVIASGAEAARVREDLAAAVAAVHFDVNPVVRRDEPASTSPIAESRRSLNYASSSRVSNPPAPVRPVSEHSASPGRAGRAHHEEGHAS